MGGIASHFETRFLCVAYPFLLSQDVVGVVDTAEQYRARLAAAASAPPDQRLPEAETTAGDLQKCEAPCFDKDTWPGNFRRLL